MPFVIRLSLVLSGDRYVRVLLAPGHAVMEAGEPGFNFSLRDYVEAQQECDVFIEGGSQTTSNLLVCWLDGHHAFAQKSSAVEAVESTAPRKRVVFDTHDPNVFVAVKGVVEGLKEGWEVCGPHYYRQRRNQDEGPNSQGKNYSTNRVMSSGDYEKTDGMSLSYSENDEEGQANQAPKARTPIVVYGRNAAATIHKAERLLNRNAVAPEDICLLLDTMQGIHQVCAPSLQLPRCCPVHAPVCNGRFHRCHNAVCFR